MTDEEIVQEAVDFMKEQLEVLSYTLALNIADLKFGLADADNGYQWPDNIAANRKNLNQPMLTINKTHQHCLQIINDAKQNKVACKVSATGDGATKESADIIEGIIRHIEYQSNAQDVYTISGVKPQVYMGIGYWKVVTDYIDDDTFDQEIYIRPVKNPLAVFLDSNITTMDGSDSRKGLEYEDVPREQFDKDYPKLKDKIGSDPLGELTSGMVKEKQIRVAMYYRRVPKRDKLIALADGTTVRRSKISPEIYAGLKEDQTTKVRAITSHEVEWFKIAGGVIVSRGKTPGSYIPLVRVPGEESTIDGQYDRRGHVRWLKDPQRMYNYWTSSAVENVALQSKSPYIGPMEAFDGLETYWNAANRTPSAWLPYNGLNAAGQPIPKPERQEPPQMGQAFMEGMQVAAQELQMVSGQYQAQMGEKSNERSGVAITQRQRQGDNATYGFIDSLASAIRFTGRIIIDMIPEVYDTPRVIQILAINGDQSAVNIDPTQKAPLQSSAPADQQPTAEAIQHIFNPAVGRYEVEADVGPAYGTARQETFNALSQIIAAAPELVHVAGDIMMRAADFPMADELAERLKNMVPAQALGGPDPQTQALQAELQKMQAALAQATMELQTEKHKRLGQEQQKGIDVFKAQTDRLKAVGTFDPTIMVPVARQTAVESLSNGLQPIDASVDAAIGQMAAPPPPPPPQPPGAAQPQGTQ